MKRGDDANDTGKPNDQVSDASSKPTTLHSAAAIYIERERDGKLEMERDGEHLWGEREARYPQHHSRGCTLERVPQRLYSRGYRTT
jgi:hypothetical protein